MIVLRNIRNPEEKLSQFILSFDGHFLLDPLKQRNLLFRFLIGAIFM